MSNYPTLNFQCKNKHIWNVLIARYWFDNKPKCPTCNKKAIQIQWGGVTSLEHIRQGLKKS